MSKLILPHLDQSLPVCNTLEASEVTQRSSSESKAAFKCYLRIQLIYPVSRSEKQSTECGDVDYIYSSHMRILYHTRALYICIKKTYASCAKGLHFSNYIGLPPPLFFRHGYSPVTSSLLQKAATIVAGLIKSHGATCNSSSHCGWKARAMRACNTFC